MEELTVHLVPGSPYGRAVLAALEERGQHYRIAAVVPGTLRTPEHLAHHPFGKIPVLYHGSYRLYETQAILRYVERAFAGPALTPRDPRAAGHMDQLIGVTDCYLFQGVANVLVFQRVVGPRVFGLVPDEAAIAAVLPRAQIVLAELARALGTGPYLVGADLTLADLHLAPQLDLFALTPEWESLTAPHPELRAWLTRLLARPSLQATTWERVAARARAA